MRIASSSLLGLALLVGFAPGARADRSEKPVAPVSLTLTSRAAADGGTLVVLDAEALRDVPAVVLTVGGETARFGATRAGQHRRLEARIAVPAEGIDVIGGARTGVADRTRTRIAELRLGPAKPEPVRRTATRTIAGRAVLEVRP